MATKPFFYICLGLTLSLPLFYIDLAVVEFFAAKGGQRTVSVVSPNNDLVSTNALVSMHQYDWSRGPLSRCNARIEH